LILEIKGSEKEIIMNRISSFKSEKIIEESLKELYSDFIVENNLSFNILNSESHKRIMNKLDIKETISGYGIKKFIVYYSNSAKEVLKKYLSDPNNKILSLLSDEATAENNNCFSSMNIVINNKSSNNKFNYINLKMNRTISKTNDNLEKNWTKLFEEYDLDIENVKFYIGDGATKSLANKMDKVFIWCLSHLLSLILKSGFDMVEIYSGIC